MTTLPQTLNVPNHRFAVVLGSGGVRSIAALGMVEVLAREGLMPDLVVGCSAGAMFGALIAAGHDANEAVRIATTLWSAEVTRKRRWRAVPQMLWPRLGRFDADFALRDDAPVMQRLEQAFGDVLIEDLRASIALPFMFAPVHIDGRRLIDGFVADPLPVSAAADAHSVVALGFESPMPQRIDGPSRMLAQVTSALTNNLMQARLAEANTCGTRLLSIVPRLERRVGLFDTQAMPYLVDAGRRATEAMLPAVRALLNRAPRLAVA